MKFESYLKNCGIYGVIYKASNGDRYLRAGKAGCVLARLPAGFEPVSAEKVQDLPDWIDQILIRGVDGLVSGELSSARIEKDGRAKDIQRIFRDESGDRMCAISQAAFALIERNDAIRIFDPSADFEPQDYEEIDSEEASGDLHDGEEITSALVIMDHTETDVLGIVFGLTALDA